MFLICKWKTSIFLHVSYSLNCAQTHMWRRLLQKCHKPECLKCCEGTCVILGRRTLKKQHNGYEHRKDMEVSIYHLGIIMGRSVTENWHAKKEDYFRTFSSCKCQKHTVSTILPLPLQNLWQSVGEYYQDIGGYGTDMLVLMAISIFLIESSYPVPLCDLLFWRGKKWNGERRKKIEKHKQLDKLSRLHLQHYIMKS